MKSFESELQRNTHMPYESAFVSNTKKQNFNFKFKVDADETVRGGAFKDLELSLARKPVIDREVDEQLARLVGFTEPKSDALLGTLSAPSGANANTLRRMNYNRLETHKDFGIVRNPNWVYLDVPDLQIKYGSQAFPAQKEQPTFTVVKLARPESKRPFRPDVRNFTRPDDLEDVHRRLAKKQPKMEVETFYIKNKLAGPTSVYAEKGKEVAYKHYIT